MNPQEKEDVVDAGKQFRGASGAAVGWRFVGYPSSVFRKVNHYVLKRMARFLNRKSQRYCRLKFSDTYYGEMAHHGLYCLSWARIARRRI